MLINERQISPHFSFNEARCKCGCGYLRVNDLLVHKLEQIRYKAGQRPVIVHSWCRCESHNKNVGGEEGSLHLYGMAADISVPGVSLPMLYQIAREIIGFDGGVGVYWKQGFVHIDVRGWPARWEE